MARLPRLVVPGHPHLIVLRGNNGQAVFADTEDRRLFVRLLGEAAKAQGVAMHAYALLDSDALLLATPGTTEALSRMAQALGRRYVAAFNRRHGRRGTLWEGRFRAGLVEADLHLLSCMRYVESAAVRAGLAVQPSDWPWSSAEHHVGRRNDPVIEDHALYWSLGNTPFEREAAYRVLLEQPLPAAQAQAIAHAAMQGWVLGSASFIAKLSEGVPRPLRPRARGRPRKVS